LLNPGFFLVIPADPLIIQGDNPPGSMSLFSVRQFAKIGKLMAVSDRFITPDRAGLIDTFPALQLIGIDPGAGSDIQSQ